jgi:hypothetical protein
MAARQLDQTTSTHQIPSLSSITHPLSSLSLSQEKDGQELDKEKKQKWRKGDKRGDSSQEQGHYLKGNVQLHIGHLVQLIKPSATYM